MVLSQPGEDRKMQPRTTISHSGNGEPATVTDKRQCQGRYAPMSNRADSDAPVDVRPVSRDLEKRTGTPPVGTSTGERLAANGSRAGGVPSNRGAEDAGVQVALQGRHVHEHDSLVCGTRTCARARISGSWW